ncbi:MAG: SAM-dependent chlorinase/fluorinase [Candidatus Nitronauta litoralis]|uniref:SAM-dependent chlorinase/fluorinase n=1 Tax=Candidatus Nitronauta litoralis TaxID=2705533 RepID=A0A7T0BU56_9BACT|nr:MAG: SAM-dependent chlorinase/fluorinase [Candidatus Nitronauta litoralis]
MSRLITLTTDFGLSDPFVGIMKGVIFGIAPKATLIDLTHDIEPQNIQQGALVLSSAAPYFPRKTIHLAVVDPGVGTSRHPIVVETPEAIFVGPDNGLLSPAFSNNATTYQLTQSEYFLESFSNTFHGRDIFAPVAAHIATGVWPSRMGKKLDEPIVLDLPRPEQNKTCLRGQVIYADHFGNLTTNISEDDLKQCLPSKPLVLKVGRRTLKQISRSYADCSKGKAGFLLNSWNAIEIFVRDGNAQQQLKIKPGTQVTLQSS